MNSHDVQILLLKEVINFLPLPARLRFLRTYSLTCGVTRGVLHGLPSSASVKSGAYSPFSLSTSSLHV
ncbi:hypothetical protein PISMIDRAFT_680177, partial [Pisolithus microcarpus 441]